MWLFIALGVLLRFSSCLGTCTKKCNQPILMYDSLKCTPVFESTIDCCPSNYNCSNIEKNAKNNMKKCYYGGKTYSDGQYVSDDDTEPFCMSGCFCIIGNPKYSLYGARFLCPSNECPEDFNGPTAPDCYFKYDLKKCCSIDEVCGPSNGTCNIKNETERIGELYSHPNDACTNCVCEKPAIGELKEHICIKHNCLSEIHNQEMVYSFCAPAYLKLKQCCPHMWICPSVTDYIKKAKKPTRHKCRFGKALLNIGDTFSRIQGKEMVSCKCSIPPYLTCIATSFYKPFRFSMRTSSASSAISMLSLITCSLLFLQYL